MARRPGARAAARLVVACLRGESGATAIEFGMVGGPLILMLCAILAIGLYFFMSAALDHAVLVGARAITTGTVSSSGMTASSFKQTVICPALGTPFSCDDVYVNVAVMKAAQSPSGFYAVVNASQSGLIPPPLDSTKTSFCPGAASQYVVLQVAYPTPFVFAFLTPANATVYNGKSVAVLLASTTFLTEPYSGAQPYTGC